MGLASVLIDRVCVSGRVSAREGARKREFCLWVFLQYSLRERESVCVVVVDGERVGVLCIGLPGNASVPVPAFQRKDYCRRCIIHTFKHTHTRFSKGRRKGLGFRTA